MNNLTTFSVLLFLFIYVCYVGVWVCVMHAYVFTGTQKYVGHLIKIISSFSKINISLNMPHNDISYMVADLQSKFV